MFWADRAVADILEERKHQVDAGELFVVRDEKTASGHPHVGSMIGVALHGLVARVLKDRGVNAIFYYEINDTDPMDGLPVYLDASVYEKHLGEPLNRVPAPDSSYAHIAEYFASDFKKVIEESGFEPTFYYTSELYNSGKMNDVIRLALEHGAEIRNIYKEVSGSQKPDDWLPLNVVCESCGKVGSTKVTDFDGETVGYVCVSKATEWADGCGHEGRVSPFNGNATLPWKVEWPAKFKVMNVAVEGAGKDHTTRGGARDIANHIAQKVFDFEPPFDIPYEYFLVGGKKMSSSKGNAATAREIKDLLPPHIFRLALVGREVTRQANFDPEGDSIPLLFDKYDRLAKAYWDKEEGDDARTYELIHASNDILLTERFLPRFSQIAFLVQMPHLKLEEEVERMKGAPLTEKDKEEIELRARYARQWIETYAPEQFRFVIQKEVTDTARTLSDMQKDALRDLHVYIEKNKDLSGEDLHHYLHELKEKHSIPPKELFSAIYQLFLDRESGPQAGWFLSTLDRDLVLSHLEEATH